ncbi:hypothetical protein O6H91_10G052600 [Diphasiastrum complanatum]|uniref:Uncharacterized protein n=2 Tax=Diphasiastrum complanatum TaxID=34168 RepID=A0ACC2CGX8_DIPCM|nr:hypothetical protein O6H91_10G039600 [Diphasiastrum complanatum]KAJ7541287.1 hypothetical protein O6H91_10G052600 [Diphasiastrum complanatum]
MPTVGLKLSSWNYKRTLKNSIREKNGALLITRKSEPRVPPNASFIDGVACKDCIIDAITGVSIRVYLPEICRGFNRAGSKAFSWLPESASTADESSDFQLDLRSFFEATEDKSTTSNSSCDDDRSEDFLQSNGAYYPQRAGHKKLPAIIQFHAGAFVNGSKDAPSNDLFCRRIAKACRSVVITVGYRLAPEHKFPSARDDGLATLRWLARQANLAIFSSSDCSRKSSSGLIDSFANMLSDPWITAHVDYSRCVVMGVGAGGTIAEQVTRVAMNMCLELEPLQISAQVLVCPLFSGVTPLPSEILLSDAYFIDRDTLALIWRLVLPEELQFMDL